MKIAVTGKGGVGKTTFAACLARLYADEGRKVLCADVDPDANLGLALGFTEEDLAAITPITEMKELIKQRTHADEFERFFKINPKVDDLPDKLAREINGVKLLLMGTVKVGGAGCVCPEHVILKRLLSHMIIQRDEVVIMDMEAGLEHLSRGTTDMVDQFIVVVEPGARSIQTYHSVQRLAKDLGVSKVSVVANKVRGEEDEAFIRSMVPEEDLLGIIHYSNDVSDADRRCASPYDIAPGAVEEIRIIKEKIDHSV
ncbi:MAG: AAA family ATPase [Firmicutes bacterium]|nr:AAA family ATPase [Bacillota bacterium]